MPAYYVHNADHDLIGVAWSADRALAEAKARRYFRRTVHLLTAGSEVLDAMLALGVEVAPYQPIPR